MHLTCTRHVNSDRRYLWLCKTGRGTAQAMTSWNIQKLIIKKLFLKTCVYGWHDTNVVSKHHCNSFHTHLFQMIIATWRSFSYGGSYCPTAVNKLSSVITMTMCSCAQICCVHTLICSHKTVYSKNIYRIWTVPAYSPIQQSLAKFQSKPCISSVLYGWQSPIKLFKQRCLVSFRVGHSWNHPSTRYRNRPSDIGVQQQPRLDTPLVSERRNRRHCQYYNSVATDVWVPRWEPLDFPCK